MNNYRNSLFAGLIFISILASACGSDPQTTSDTEVPEDVASTTEATDEAAPTADGSANDPTTADPIKIGNVTSITNLGGTFDGYQAGVISYFEWLNDQGGIDGREVELITVDDEGDPAKNAAAVRGLVENDNIVATVGDATQGSTAGGAPFLEEQGIPSIGGWGNGEEWFGPYDNLFVIVSSQGEQRCAPWLADMAISEQAENVAFFGYDIPIGIQDIECHLAAWEAQGQDQPLVAPAYASLTQADYRPIVQPAIEANAENLIINVGPADVARIIEAAEQLGFEGNYFGGGGVQNSMMEALGPELSERIAGRLFGPSFALLPSNDDNELIQNFKEYIPTEFADDPFSVPGWAAGVIFTDAVKAAGVDSDALLEYMYDLPDGYDAQGLIGPQDYTRDELGPARCILYILWNGEAFEPTSTSEDGFQCSEVIDPQEYNAFK